MQRQGRYIDPALCAGHGLELTLRGNWMRIHHFHGEQSRFRMMWPLHDECIVQDLMDDLYDYGAVPKMSPEVLSIFDLSPSEKLQLVEDLWDDLASNPEDVPVHEWQREELDRRRASFMTNPSAGLTWEEVKRRVRSRHGR